MKKHFQEQITCHLSHNADKCLYYDEISNVLNTADGFKKYSVIQNITLLAAYSLNSILASYAY